MLRGGNRRPFEVARAGGLATSIDVNWDPRWNISSPAENQRRKQAVRDLLPLIDLVHGNIRELTAFAGCGALDDALAKIVAWGAAAVVVHMGTAGAGYFDGLVAPPSPPARHVNKTGTRDVLSVCMMLPHRLETPPHDKLRLANPIVAAYTEGDHAFVLEL